MVGQVRGIQQRSESYGEHGAESVLTFRLERYDRAGNRLRPVPVQLRSYGFDGSLNEGDEVRVTGRWKHGTLHTSRVHNLTTGASVRGKSIKKRVLIALAVFAVVVTVIVAGIVFIAIPAEKASQKEYQEQVDQQDREWQEQHREWCQDAAKNGMTPAPC